MQRPGSIVYLGREGDEKSCRGLEAIVEDGWGVVLVIGYRPAPGQVTKRKQPLSDRMAHGLASAIRALTPLRVIARVARRMLGWKRQSKPGEPQYPMMGELCAARGIAYCETSDKTLASLRDRLGALGAEVIMTNGWEFKVTPDIFSLAQLVALNCHSSYLPEYRGGNVTWAVLINEEKQSGVTVHEMVEQIDAGRILAQQRVDVARDETRVSLHSKRARITGPVLTEALEVAGHEARYKENPPSPFYYRCDYATYRRYKRINRFRKLLGLPIKRYEPDQKPGI
jgi:hypothetical protein